MENKTIDYRFKILYAVGMIMVVCGHTPGGGIVLLGDWFPYPGLSLALFAFCSGYFYKSASEEALIKYIWKKVRSLIIPLYIYTFCYGLIVMLMHSKGFTMGGEFNIDNLIVKPITSGHQFIYNMGGWFVVPLFIVEVYNVLFRKALKTIIKSIPEWVFFTINVGLGILGIEIAIMGHIEGWWLLLTRTLYFVPFYGLGMFYKSTIEKYERKIKTFWLFTFIFAAKLIIALIYGKMPMYTPSVCNDFTEGPVMPIIVGYLGIIFWMRMATIFEPVIGKSKPINLIADNTYSIMMNQFMGFMAVKTVYALIYKYKLGFADFDWVNYKNEVFWYYIPKGLSYTVIIYVIVGIVIPILIQKLIDFIKIHTYALIAHREK